MAIQRSDVRSQGFECSLQALSLIQATEFERWAEVPPQNRRLAGTYLHAKEAAERVSYSGNAVLKDHLYWSIAHIGLFVRKPQSKKTPNRFKNIELVTEMAEESGLERDAGGTLSGGTSSRARIILKCSRTS